MGKFLIMCLVALFSANMNCGGKSGNEQASGGQPDAGTPSPASGDGFVLARHEMVKRQIQSRGVTDKNVLNAMRKVPRHLFIPERNRAEAYDDRPLPIGNGQTISQPYIVALMTELLALKSGDKVLEIGTGSGYQAAVLAELCGEVYSVEIIEELGKKAESLLSELGYANIKVKIGDGYLGWPEHAAFDGIIATCAPDDIPGPLIEQLAEGGRMVIPVGDYPRQTLKRAVKKDGRLHYQDMGAVVFVPMTGRAQDKK